MTNTSQPKAPPLSFKVAYSGIICALAVMIQFMAIVPGFTYVLPAVSGLFIWTISSQISRKWAFLSYAATAMLSVFLVPEPEAVAFFIAFFGYYPTLRALFTRLKSGLFRAALKLLLFNAAVVVTFKLVSMVFGVDKMLEGLESFGTYAVYVLWGAANFAFICYDYCLTQVFYAFEKWLKPKFFKYRGRS